MDITDDEASIRPVIPHPHQPIIPRLTEYYAFVIVFDRQEMVRPVVLVDLAQGGLIGVQGIEHDQLAFQGSALFEQGAGGGDFVGFFLDQSGAQQLLGPVMGDVVILALALKSPGRPELLPTLRLVAGAAKKLTADKAFHGQNTMPGVLDTAGVLAIHRIPHTNFSSSFIRHPRFAKVGSLSSQRGSGIRSCPFRSLDAVPRRRKSRFARCGLHPMVAPMNFLVRLFLTALLYAPLAVFSADERHGATLRVLQFNIWQEGTSVPGGVEKIADAILQSRADVVAFSEVRNYRKEDWHGKILAALKAKAPELVFHGQYVGGDVGLVSRLPIASTAPVFDETKSDTGSVMAYRLALPGERELTVCTAHLDYKHYALNWVRGYGGGNPGWKMLDANNDGEPDRVSDAAAVLAENRRSRRGPAIAAFLAFAEKERAAGRAVILAGDFNEGSHLDWTEKANDFAGHYGAVLAWDNSLALEKAGFRDAWRVLFPDEVKHPGFTWPATAFGKKTTSWAPKSDERDRIDFIYYSADAGLRPVQAWMVGPHTCFIGERKVDDPGEDAFLCADLPWPSDHKGVLAEFAY
jgi:endonuclease/exonuclease/phosphatase family metal-dependent hydrolase